MLTTSWIRLSAVFKVKILHLNF